MSPSRARSSSGTVVLIHEREESAQPDLHSAADPLAPTLASKPSYGRRSVVALPALIAITGCKLRATGSTIIELTE